MSFKLFHWRTRVKTATPEVAGSAVETLPSHVSDINAHPDYLKKGAAVPTGQEEVSLARHEISPLAHSKNYIRRSEILKTFDQYTSAKFSDITDSQNNYNAESPQRYIVTAYILNLAFNDMFTKGKLVSGPVGNGSQLIYVDSANNIVLSTTTIGSEGQFVYIKDGVVTAATESFGTGSCPIYIEDGVLKSSTSSIGAANLPVYMEKGVIKPCTVSLEIPVGGCFTTTYAVDNVHDLLGYGTWSLLTIVGNNEAKIWQRVQDIA